MGGLITIIGKLKRSTIYNDESGYILQIVMVFLLIMSILGFAILTLASQENKIALNYQQRVEALYHAQAGIKKAVWIINSCNNSQATFSNSQMNVVYDSIQYRLVAHGISGSHIKSVDVELEPDHPFRHILNYQQLSTDGGTIIVYTPGHQKKYCPDFPQIDFSYWNAIADYRFTGDQIFSSSLASGIYYVDGNVRIHNINLFVGVIVSTGNVELRNSCRLSAMQIPDSELYYPVIISSDSIVSNYEVAPFSIQISGAVYAGDLIKLEDDYVTGPLTAPKIRLSSLSLVYDGLNRKYYNYSPGFEPVDDLSCPKIEKIGSWKILN